MSSINDAEYEYDQQMFDEAAERDEYSDELPRTPSSTWWDDRPLARKEIKDARH